MSGLIDSAAHLERELSPEPIAGPAVGAIALHLALGLLLGYYAWILGLFHHNVWGTAGLGGSMHVTLVAPLPLPSEQVNQNVLSTETPSQAPAPPSPKEQHQVDETAIPILGKHAKPQQKTTPKTPPHQPVQRNQVYGEQAGTNIPHELSPQTASNGPTNVGDNDFASMFGWYVDQINRKMSQSWYKSEVDPHTPRGARVYLTFSISRDGTPSNVQLARSSGSQTLDISCERGVQRVDTFGPLPGSYNKSTLNVSYYCEY